MVYRVAGYGEKVITGNYTIGLPDHLISALNNSLKPVHTYPTRNPLDPKSCFPLPEKVFNVSPWPVDGTTVLAGEPLLIRWIENSENCEDLVLVIVPEDGHVRKIPMKTGEIISVNKLTPGQKYHWYVEDPEKRNMDPKNSGVRISPRVSKIYNFQILDQETTKEIHQAMGKVAEFYHGNRPMVHQAMYLQVISDANSGIDLYADSFRLLRELSSKWEIDEEVMEPIYQHCWPNS